MELHMVLDQNTLPASRWNFYIRSLLRTLFMHDIEFLNKNTEVG